MPELNTPQSISELAKRTAQGGDQGNWGFGNVLPFIKNLADAVTKIVGGAGGPGKFFGAGTPPQGISGRPGIQGLVNQASAATPELIPSHTPFQQPIAPEMAVSHGPSAPIPGPAPAPAPAPAVKPEAPTTGETEVSPLDQLYQDMADTREKLQAKMAEIEKAGEKMTTEQKKITDDLILELRRKETELKGLAFPRMNTPPPPELQDTQQKLGIMAPIITGVIAIATMLRGGTTAIDFAQTYNGMVDAFREYDYGQFMAKSREFENFLKAETTANNQKLLEYEDTISKVMRGINTDVEIAKLKSEQVQAPLQLNMQYFKLLEDLTTKYQAMINSAQTQQYHNIMAMFAGQRNAIALRREALQESQEGYKKEKALAETTAAKEKVKESQARVKYLESKTAQTEAKTAKSIIQQRMEIQVEADTTGQKVSQWFTDDQGKLIGKTDKGQMIKAR